MTVAATPFRNNRVTNLLVVRGTALEPFGVASMTKAKPITAHYQPFWERVWQV